MTDKDSISNSSKFKNMGVDVNFIEKNANKQNSTINELYHGGKRDQPEEQPAAEPRQAPEAEQPQQVQERVVTQVVQSEVDYDKIQEMINQAVVDKVNELATTMQAYANQTDATLEGLRQSINNLGQTKTANKPVVEPKQEQQKQLDPEKPSNKPVVPGQTSGFSPESVSIENMFNFAGKPTGKR